MKTIFCIIALFCIFSCKKQDVPEQTFPAWATATALKNNNTWVSDRPLAKLNAKGELIIDLDVMLPNSRSKEAVNYNLPLRIGKYIIENQYTGLGGSDDVVPSMSYFFSRGDGDLIGLGDLIPKDTLNQCTIEEIDFKQKKVSGKFSAAIYIDYDKKRFDTIIFKNGRFTVGY
jgi:hypothetical protein